MESNINGKVIPLNSKHRLLNQLERHGFSPSYQCRNGMCGECRCKLKSGKVSVIDDVLVPLESDEILTCISIPKTPISIEFDYEI